MFTFTSVHRVNVQHSLDITKTQLRCTWCYRANQL